MPATAKFLQAVAGLPQGAVVLPGLDTDLDDEAWQSIGGVSDAQGKFTTPPASNHPQFAMHALLQRFGIKRSDVETSGRRRRRTAARCWPPKRCGPRTPPRNGISGWREPDIAEKISGGMTNLAVIEAANPEMEALAIAVAMREARQLGQIGRAGDAGPRAGAARDGGARPLESRVRRFRRRCADGNVSRNFRAAGRGGGGETAGAADLAGAAEASAVAGWVARKAPSRRAIETLELALLRGTRPQAGSARSACANSTGFAPSSPSSNAARHPRCMAPSRGQSSRNDELDHARATDRRLAGGACAAGKSRSVEAA